MPEERRYSPVNEARVRDVYRTLSEKDRRRFAAVQASLLPHGGREYLAGLLGCSTRTIARGVAELDELGAGDPAEGRVRREGAGRPPLRPTAPK